MTFGQFIRDIRESKGISLRFLAGHIGIAPAYMSDIEKGKRYPPPGRLQRIAAVLRMTKEERDEMYDLAGKARNSAPEDITPYLLTHDSAIRTLRFAAEHGISDSEWIRILEQLEESLEK
jgi:transcriptional regulator with XRE-family HTH domain